MTVAATSRVAGPFNGDGVQVNFDFTFKIFATTDVVVTHTTAAGVESTKVLNTDYTVAMNADQDVSPGGRVTMVVAPLGGGTPEKVTLSSNVPESQGTSLPTGSGWQAKVVEKALDKATILVGQLRALLTRIPKYPISDGTTAKDLPNLAARKSTALGFDSNGDFTTYSAASGVTDAGNVGYTPTYGALAGVAHTVKSFLDKLAQAGTNLGAALIGFLQSGTGAVARTMQSKARDSVSTADYGTAGDSTDVALGTDDATAVQKTVDAGPMWSLAGISGTAGSATVGGAMLRLVAKALGYRIGASVNITNSKVIIEGPARLNLDNGITAFLFNFVGSTNKSGVQFRYIDFVGGATAINGGQNSDAQPWMAYRCRFINQSVASVITGNNGFWIDLVECRFAGNKKAIWHKGTSADGVNVRRCVFDYNDSTDSDIVIENGANVAFIDDNDFIGNKAAGVGHIKIDTTVAQGGSYSRIAGNKFGQESRTTGNHIVITGANPLIGARIVNNPIMGFDSSAPGGSIKIVGTPLLGCTIKGNVLVYAGLFDSASTQVNDGNDGDNEIGPNFYQPLTKTNVARGGSVLRDFSEPAPDDKFNILAWSKFVNSGADFTYTNATPTYMSAADEKGRANNATTVLATAANNIIRINSLNTNNDQKLYTFALWAKLDVAGAITIKASRGGDVAFNKALTLGTAYTRIPIEFFQTYLAAGFPYAVDITIPNGRTITLGTVTGVPGRDAGDLFRSGEMIEYANGRITSTVAPTLAMYSPAGRVAKNAAPAVGSPKGWVCTVAGSPGTWVSEGNL